MGFTGTILSRSSQADGSRLRPDYNVSRLWGPVDQFDSAVHCHSPAGADRAASQAYLKFHAAPVPDDQLSADGGATARQLMTAAARLAPGFSKLVFLHLAHCVAGQGINKENRFWAFEFCQSLLQWRNDLVLCL